MEYFVEFFGGEEAEGDAGFFEADVLVECLVRGLGGVLIADVRVEGGDEHERAMKVFRASSHGSP